MLLIDAAVVIAQQKNETNEFDVIGFENIIPNVTNVPGTGTFILFCRQMAVKSEKLLLILRVFLDFSMEAMEYDLKIMNSKSASVPAISKFILLSNVGEIGDNYLRCFQMPKKISQRMQKNKHFKILHRIDNRLKHCHHNFTSTVVDHRWDVIKCVQSSKIDQSMTELMLCFVFLCFVFSYML